MLNMNLEERIVIETLKMDWMESPSKGVWRKPLEREAAESGHVTSIVKYEAGSKFPTHTHPMGEEIFVLDGVFSDETGDFGPALTFETHQAPAMHHLVTKAAPYWSSSTSLTNGI